MKIIISQDKRIVLFEDDDISNAYLKSDALKNFEIIGLINDNDFLVKDHDDKIYSIPTVPLDSDHLEPFHFNIETEEKVTELKILWYVQPLIFGGSPFAKENMKKVDLETHIGLVNWWNDKYKEIKRED